ncbi:hypothetical protein TrST_g10442 [Triparma strigata]|uniref:Fe2OG dioxygenase domain-containing protein n=1 Tax=Triparma strigata TaxID=1606541 RepID=A0A9W7F352_9STRA|nr:hypothetical protein TrST_g10442 [Triparma strigata]
MVHNIGSWESTAAVAVAVAVAVAIFMVGPSKNFEVWCLDDFDEFRQAILDESSHNLFEEAIFRLDGTRLKSWEEVGEFVAFSKAAGDSRAKVLCSPPSSSGSAFVWPLTLPNHKHIVSEEAVSPAIEGKPVELESITLPQTGTVSNGPRVFEVHNFFSEAEADAIMLAAKNDLKASSLARQGISKEAVRSSDSAFLNPKSTVATAIMERAFNLLRIGQYKRTRIENVQVVRYNDKGDAYNTHNDYLSEGTDYNFNFDPSAGGSNRLATILMYLSDVEAGGQTHFPYLNEGVESASQQNEPKLEEHLSSFEARMGADSWQVELAKNCASHGSVTPRKGRAVLFYSQTPNATLDLYSLHGGCPVLAGDEKWMANIWIWNKDQPIYRDEKGEFYLYASGQSSERYQLVNGFKGKPPKKEGRGQNREEVDFVKEKRPVQKGGKTKKKLIL